MSEESHSRAGRRKYNRSVGWLKRGDLDAGYRRMAQDTKREAAAAEWVEGTSEPIVDAM